jgi:hypothetical protein
VAPSCSLPQFNAISSAGGPIGWVKFLLSSSSKIEKRKKIGLLVAGMPVALCPYFVSVLSGDGVCCCLSLAWGMSILLLSSGEMSLKICLLMVYLASPKDWSISTSALGFSAGYCLLPDCYMVIRGLLLAVS